MKQRSPVFFEKEKVLNMDLKDFFERLKESEVLENSILSNFINWLKNVPKSSMFLKGVTT